MVVDVEAPRKRTLFFKHLICKIKENIIHPYNDRLGAVCLFTDECATIDVEKLLGR